MAYLKPTTEEASSDPLFNMGRRLRNLTAGDQRFFAGSGFLMRLPLWFSNARRLKTSAAAKSRRSLWASTLRPPNPPDGKNKHFLVSLDGLYQFPLI
jgi:hypothetical protein